MRLVDWQRCETIAARVGSSRRTGKIRSHRVEDRTGGTGDRSVWKDSISLQCSSVSTAGSGGMHVRLSLALDRSAIDDEPASLFDDMQALYEH